MTHSTQAKTLDQTIAAILALDMTPIKFKATRQEDGYGWTAEHADKMELGYKRYLILHAKHPEMTLAPEQDIDRFWHMHILDTRKYAADCEATFGHFLHHFPYLGLRGEGDEEALQEAFVKMQQLYAAEFGEPVASLQRDAAWCSLETAAASAAWCSAEMANATPAWCSLETVKASAAWCSLEAPKVSAAWCSLEAPKAKAAWCSLEAPKVTAAWCSLETPKVAAAWCSLEAPKAVAESPKAKAAWCSLETTQPSVAWCSISSPKASAAWCSLESGERKAAASQADEAPMLLAPAAA